MLFTLGDKLFIDFSSYWDGWPWCSKRQQTVLTYHIADGRSFIRERESLMWHWHPQISGSSLAVTPVSANELLLCVLVTMLLDMKDWMISFAAYCTAGNPPSNTWILVHVPHCTSNGILILRLFLKGLPLLLKRACAHACTHTHRWTVLCQDIYSKKLHL